MINAPPTKKMLLIYFMNRSPHYFFHTAEGCRLLKLTFGGGGGFGILIILSGRCNCTSGTDCPELLTLLFLEPGVLDFILCLILSTFESRAASNGEKLLDLAGASSLTDGGEESW
jgi:hypothetical protein